jgi:hypothetical protein
VALTVMSTPRAIAGDFADIRTVKSRSVVQLIIELPIEQGEAVVKMFGFPQPGSPTKLALARLVEGSVTKLDDHRSPEAGKRQWNDMQPAQQAGIRCNEKAFWRYLNEAGYADEYESEHGVDAINSPERAALYVRMICGVQSRSEIGKTVASLMKWKALDSEYQAWLSAPASVPLDALVPGGVG